MELVQFDSAEAFLAEARPHLEANEAAYGLMLGVASRLTENLEAYGSAPFMAAVRNARETTLFALMTPPFPLQLLVVGEEESAAALHVIAGKLHNEDWPVSGVMASESLGTAFADCWKARTGRDYYVAMHSRVHVLHAVRHPEYSPGVFRAAREEEVEMVTKWHLAFEEDAHVPTATGEADARKRVAEGIAETRIFVWDDGGSVSTALRTRSTPRSEAVGDVYTPPALRGRGYATSCVAQLSQQILDSGKEFCTLFTDLANPTSNKIYHGIGYKPVCDYVHITFEE